MAGKKLLVADDSLTIQKVIRLALSNEGYEIQTVSDGNDALQQIAVFRPDLVLIDVSLPGRTAFEVKRTVNSQNDSRHVKFVLMSSAFEKVDEAQVTEVNFDGRLTKPFDPAHLRQVLIDVLSLPTDVSSSTSTDALESSFGKDPLWGNEEKFGDLAPPPLSRATSSDSDIKNLTESTIRMSGLDDYQWSVNEVAKKEEFTRTDLSISQPTMTPPTSMADFGSSTFNLDSTHQDLSGMPPFDFGEAEHSLGESHSIPGLSEPPPPPVSQPSAQMQADVMALGSSQMEALIQKQLEQTVMQMAKKMLPELAERLIKQEIHRMLSESP